MRGDAHTLLAPYAVDAVDTDERLAVEAHLAECDVCRADLVGMRETLAVLAGGSEQAPPPGMRRQVLARAAATAQERPVPAPFPAGTGAASAPEPAAGSGLRPRAPRLLVALAAGLAVLSVLGAAATGVLWQRLGDARDDRDVTARVLAAGDAQVLRGDATLPPDLAAVAPGGDVVVVSSESVGAAVLVASGLPPATPGSDWQAWTLRGDSARSEGVFDALGGTVLLEGGLGDASAVAVSLEPDGGSQAPTTTPVAVLELEA